MDFLLSRSAILLLSFLATWFLGFSSVLGQDLRETDALCNTDGCLVVYFERKIFLDSWRSCKEEGGNLAVIKRKEDASAIATLFSTLDLRQSRTTVQVWIGLQRQPRQCNGRLPLRGYSWTTGDQDTEYTNWKREDFPSTCLVPRCVLLGYSIDEQSDNFKWLDSSCTVPADGYLCHFAYEGMCSALWSDRADNTVYTTPFNLVSTILTHVPLGSMATILCPTDNNEDWSPILCTLRDGSVEWSREPPLCTDLSTSQNPCDQNNGGCEHFCQNVNGQSFCECGNNYHLGNDGQTCEHNNDCLGFPCEYECLPLPGGYRCACPDGYMLTPDGHGCLDVDECIQSPCEQICMNVPGTFECQCRDGYILNDEGECKDVDECAKYPCEHICENTLGSHICLCDQGYSVDPQDQSRCQDVDDCQNAGICDQMCANYDGGFECYCNEGYELMSDHYTCQKIEGGDYVSIATHQPEFVLDVVHYAWNLDSSTLLPSEKEQTVDWLIETHEDLDSDVISQNEHSFDLALGSRTQVHLLESEGTVPTTTSPTTTSDLNKDNDEEATTALPIPSASTISEGAWNWWPRMVTSTQSPVNQDVTQTKGSAELCSHKQVEEKPLQKEFSQFPEESENDKNYVEISHTQGPAPFQFTTSQPPVGEGGRGGVNNKVQKQNGVRLLVGLLVPICIFVVVMVALGIVYCTRCAVKPRNKNSPNCYHWISGAHSKQGASNLSTGGKTPI